LPAKFLDNAPTQWQPDREGGNRDTEREREKEKEYI